MLSYLASSIGTSEPALRLLFTLLSAYPLGLIHRLFLNEQPPTIHHLYIIVCGLSLSYFNYGTDIIHSIICVVFVYALLQICGRKRESVAISFIFNMAYLLIGYYCTSTKDYDITWTLPHCVLALRLIGLTFDVYDGAKNPSELSKDQVKTALEKSPTLLEIAGHSYFFGGFIVGPQFSMSRYLNFVHNRVPASVLNGKPSCIYSAGMNLFWGIIILSFYQLGSMLVPEKYILSESFFNLPLWAKVFMIGLWGKICLHKYVACWLISEGSCILTGMTYNGKDANGEIKWDGCNNIDLKQFEYTGSFEGIIKSFNINTNLWVSQYVFKRLRFLGNKSISHLSALMFLAVWHGLHSGYYLCFLNEFLVMKFERAIVFQISKSTHLTNFFNLKLLKIPLTIFLKLYVACLFGYSIIPFVMLSVDRWMQVYSSMYFIGHIILIGLPASHILYSKLKKTFSKRPPKPDTPKED